MTSALCGGAIRTVRRVLRCPIEKKRRRVVGYDGGPWYGTTWTCCACGDSWQEGEILPRPFARGWRQRASHRARGDWLTAMTPADFLAAWQADLEAELTWEVGAKEEHNP